MSFEKEIDSPATDHRTLEPDHGFGLLFSEAFSFLRDTARQTPNR
jgi:hypothetical protein